MLSLRGKKVIVTGGASGIGLAISKLFHQQGAVVHMFDLNAALAAEKAAEIGPGVHPHGIDVTDQLAVRSLMDAIAVEGNIDILVNSAGISHIGTAETTSEEDFDRVMKVNVKGVYNGIHCVLPHMLKQGGGVILNMCSVAGSVGIADRFAYGVSKGAILTMTLSVAKDFVKKGIRCNCISPGRVHTPFVDGFLQKNYPGREQEMFEKLAATQPIGRMAKPEEVANLALFLCSDEASFITGSDYPIDGGFIRINN
jgi:NAD(P)-dependent dehydrogenase (short-subunit alcohol dehydrogenase family)